MGPVSALRAYALVGVALLVVLGRLAVAGSTPLVVDELYYWAWSRRLDAGYFDHPPAVAWLVALGGWLGRTPLAVRLGPVLISSLALLLLLRHARHRWLFLAAVAGAPLYALGGVLATPDLPLLAGWALALAGVARGDRTGWAVAGLGFGLAGLGKLTGYGLPVLVLLAVPREWRRWLGAMALALVCWGPNLAWNARHDWIAWRFQLDHGLGREPPGPIGALEFLGAQAGLLTPVLFLACVLAWRRGYHGDRVDRLCWWTSAPVVAWFAFAATRSPAEANWAAPAWLGACLLLARAPVEGTRLLRLAGVGAGMAAAASVLVLVHVHHPLRAIPGDPTGRLGEGRLLAQSVEAWGIPTVYTSRYQEAAIVAFYTGLEAVALPGVDRPDQYDLWPTPWAERGLYVRPFRSGDTWNVDAFCTRVGDASVVSEPERVVAGEATGRRRWQVVEVTGCSPPDPTASGHVGDGPAR